MNNQEAKFILQAYRPGGSDASDATFCDALQQAKSDPELGRWFETEQALDRAITAKLRDALPPAGLRDAIIAGVRVSGAPRAWWRRPSWIALAACVAVLVGTSVFFLRSGVPSATGFESFAIDDVQHGHHGGHDEETGQLVALLSRPDTRLGAGLPIDLARLRATGCRTLNFAGHDVLEVCFQRGGSEFHLYVMGHDALRGGAADPIFMEKEGMRAALWSDAKHTYVVATAAGLDAVKSIL